MPSDTPAPKAEPSDEALIDVVAVAALVERLEATPNWKREAFGQHWKDGTLTYDRAPFEAADMLKAMWAELARWRVGELCSPHEAELLEERAMLKARAEAAEAALAECRAAVVEAERMFRWYGDLHAAKEQTPDNADKTKRNYDMADKMARALAKEAPR
jgi:hypothetical protein